MSIFGDKVRKLRESNGMLLRELASEIKIDQALLSKIERGERIATKKQAVLLAEFFQINEQEFLSQWLGDKIAYEIRDEDIASVALKIAEKEVAFYRKFKRKVCHV